MNAVRPEHYEGTHVAEGCFDLPTRTIIDPDYGTVVESTWELTGDELAEVLQSKRIRLKIVGGQPPVMLEVVHHKEP